MFKLLSKIKILKKQLYYELNYCLALTGGIHPNWKGWME